MALRAWTVMCATSRLEPNGFTQAKKQKKKEGTRRIWDNQTMEKITNKVKIMKKASYPKQFVKWHNEINSQVHEVESLFYFFSVWKSLCNDVWVGYTFTVVY